MPATERGWVIIKLASDELSEVNDQQISYKTFIGVHLTMHLVCVCVCVCVYVLSFKSSKNTCTYPAQALHLHAAAIITRKMIIIMWGEPSLIASGVL